MSKKWMAMAGVSVIDAATRRRTVLDRRWMAECCLTDEAIGGGSLREQIAFSKSHHQFTKVEKWRKLS